MRGLKQIVRSYIQKAEINLYTDTFKVLMKYDDHYILEDVCADIYRRCVRSINNSCAVDNIEFTSYVKEIIGDDLGMKNVAMNKLELEFSVLKKETETADDILTLKAKIVELEKDKSEIKKIVNATKSEIKVIIAATETLVSVQKKDKKEIKEFVIAKTESVSAQKDQNEIDHVKASISTLQNNFSEFKKDMVKCLNCESFECKHAEQVNFRREGMKVKVVGRGHTCKLYGHIEDFTVPVGTHGVMCLDRHSGIKWNYSTAKQLTCGCGRDSSFNNIVYLCKY